MRKIITEVGDVIYPFNVTLHCKIVEDKKDKVYYATCLENGIMSHGETEVEAWFMVQDAIEGVHDSKLEMRLLDPDVLFADEDDDETEKETRPHG